MFVLGIHNSVILPIGMQRMSHESYSSERNGKSIAVKFNCLCICTGKNNFLFFKKELDNFWISFFCQGNKIAKNQWIISFVYVNDTLWAAAAAIRTDTGTLLASSLTQQQAILLRTDWNFFFQYSVSFRYDGVIKTTLFNIKEALCSTPMEHRTKTQASQCYKRTFHGTI